MIDIGLHLLQSNNLFQTLMFLVSDLFWECVRCFFVFFGSLGEMFQGFGGEWPKSLMTFQCSVISEMTRDDILEKIAPFHETLSTSPSWKWQKLTNWYCCLLHYQPRCHVWGVLDDVVFVFFRKISLERELMRLRKGALNAYGSLDGPMLHDDVELEVGKKLQMLLLLIKFVKGCHFNPFHSI